jgi:hypothetical protein
VLDTRGHWHGAVIYIQGIVIGSIVIIAVEIGGAEALEECVVIGLQAQKSPLMVKSTGLNGGIDEI